MNTTFMLSGGLGRVISAIPALEKYALNNPEDDFKVIVAGWTDVFLSHPLLQNRTFESNDRGVWENHIKPNNLVTPEPYHLHNWYNKKITMSEAFDEMINKTVDHSDLKQKGYLYLSKSETEFAKQLINPVKNERKIDYCIMTNPFGSTAEIINGEIVDNTARSMTAENYYQFVNHFKQKLVMIYAGESGFRNISDNITIDFNPTRFSFIRTWMALTSQCDYFVGCDSAGHHIAKAFGIPGTVLMGGTGDMPCCYPDHFKIHRKREENWIPMRITGNDEQYCHRDNEDLMNFSSEEMENINNSIETDIEKCI